MNVCPNFEDYDFILFNAKKYLMFMATKIGCGKVQDDPVAFLCVEQR
jgi:hypothetical protein